MPRPYSLEKLRADVVEFLQRRPNTSFAELVVEMRVASMLLSLNLEPVQIEQLVIEMVRTGEIVLGVPPQNKGEANRGGG